MNVLAIGAHPDDIEVACCGTLAKCVKRGDRVIVCHVSTGNLGHVIIPPDELTRIRAAEAKRAQELLEEAQALAKQIEAGSLSLKIKGGEGGRTFGSVSTKEIAVAMKEQLKLDIDKKKLQLADPIRNFGTYHVPIRLHPKVTAEITVKVEQA